MTTHPEVPERTGSGADALEQASDVDARAKHHLKPNAISLSGGIALGLASAAPTATVAVILASLMAEASYASPLVVFIVGLPMLGVALAFRRLNHWRVDCGATYVWAARAVNPVFGFGAGWIIVLTYFFAVSVSVSSMGPYLLSIFSNDLATSQLGQGLVATVAVCIAAGINILGIRPAVRLERVLVTIEVTAVLLLALFALSTLLSGSFEAVSFDTGWFSWDTLGGATGFVGAALIGVFVFAGWDTPAFASEETENPRKNPGTAVVVAVAFLALFFPFLIFCFQGAASPEAIQDNGANILYYFANLFGGSVLAKLFVAVVFVSAFGGTIAYLLSVARVSFAMGEDRVLPTGLARLHPRFSTPYFAVAGFAALAIVIEWIYVLGSATVQDTYTALVSMNGMLFTLYYLTTALTMAFYYRRVILASTRNVIELGVVPLASVAFLTFIAIKSVPNLGGWGGRTMVYLYVMLGVGAVAFLWARFKARSPYFDLARDSYDPEHAPLRDDAGAGAA